MSPPTPVQRLGQRCTVREPAAIRLPVKGRLGRVRVETRPVTLVEISVSGASLEVGPGVGLAPRQTIELELEGRLGVCRVVWVRPISEGEVRCGVQFLDPNPAFLPTLYRWLGRDSMADQRMRG